MQIDAHQHYWQPKRGDYDWMPQGDPVLDRQYRPADLVQHLGAHRINKTVLVQAAATVAETEYMLGIADATDHVAGVVGWIDFENPNDAATLTRLAKHPKFLGVRPMIQDIEDVDWMLRDDVQWAYHALSDLGLTFDALGFPRHLDNFAKLLGNYPDLKVVVDHCMKPDVAGHTDAKFDTWADGMRRLADRPGTCCKLSGLVTEAAEGWTIDDLRPYGELVLEAFGPERVMWGSDWPVCQLRASYGDWRRGAETLCAPLSGDDRAMVFGGTAARFYGLGN